mmetsp:Transcript_12533/g.18730  ORF Transcript_12533/g.18730 Transcript_12533/m.18730 type:complete len:393 (-) Transcript_12533:117-1295(-)|eukprot:CAMPEP_0167754278 /NCGR_PEP_ID=MMETSP0110_2-20121227/8180_1 /TAXON_ID=629695 /ORGANISM="Gymnochlora sp., Strain CCMP2014" /LENGTH=392 /DNA_ID=CAMNT_0007640137 /DNA_START=14 /DNA_END=1192 /DNA_ORIENTATION=-
MSTQTAFVNVMNADTGIWEAAACGDIELIMMMPSDYKKKEDFASCVEDHTPLRLIDRIPEGLRGYIRATLYILLYMMAGPALIMCNKTLVKDTGFKFPMTLSLWSQCVGSLITFSHVHIGGAHLPNKHKATNTFLLTQILPIGALMALKMMLGMKAFLYCTVSFIQIFKAFSPAITLAVTTFAGLDSPTKKVVFSVLAMCCGMGVSAFGELNFSVIGVTIIFIAQLADAFRLMLMQKSVKKLKFRAIELQYYRAPACALVLLCVAAVMEFPKIYQTGAYEKMLANIHLFILQAFLGFAVNIVNTLVIKITSSVTLKALAVVRNAVLVLVNVAFFGEVVTARQIIGYGLLLVAFGFFQKYSREQRRRDNLKKKSDDIELKPKPVSSPESNKGL